LLVADDAGRNGRRRTRRRGIHALETVAPRRRRGAQKRIVSIWMLNPKWLSRVRPE
jgi:hypothetical protein